MADQPRDGRMLTGGERLRLDVEQVRSGGGEKFHPTTASEAAERLAPQLAELTQSFQATPDRLHGSARYFQTTLLPNYLAASYFPSQLLRESGLVAVGSRAELSTYDTSKQSAPATTKSLIVAGSPDSIRRLQDIVAGGGQGPKSERDAFEQLREISDVRLPTRTEVFGAEDRRDAHVWEAVLNPAGASRQGELLPTDEFTFGKWIALVESLDGRVVADFRREESGLTFVPVELDPDAAAEAALFNPLRSFRPMPELRPIVVGPFRSAPPRVYPAANPTPAASHIVAIFDGGIGPDSGLDAATETDLTGQPAVADALNHGTAVTGAALHGLASPGRQLDQPASEVHHYRLFPTPPETAGFEIYWMLDEIERITTTNDYPIVNLSLGPDECVEDASEPNRWTSTLDRLAYERDILFVSAAGNNGRSDSNTGLNRVQSPADMANGISVGACDSSHDDTWERTAYSAIGPGRSGSRVQPTGVQFGGDLDAGVPFHAVQRGLHISQCDGTSFATPLVVNSLSKLGALLGDDWVTSNTIRACATHFTERHRQEDTRFETGHGRFNLDYDGALSCAPNEVHVLYQDRLDRDQLLSVALPVPASVVTGMVELRMTIAFTSQVEPTQPLEYTQATIEPVFRPHADKFRLRRGKSTRIVNVVSDGETAAKLLADGFQLSGHPTSKQLPGSVGPETDLREGGKWETVRRYDLNMQARSLLAPRLDLSYLARQSGLLDRQAPPLDFTLVVSVTTPKLPTLFSDVQTAFPVLSPLGVAVTPPVTAT